MPESLGTRLRQERERRRIGLKSIAENTKINLSLLQGLERDDVSRWPGGIYRKSYVRSYAQALGLDPESIVREFVERHPDTLDAPAPPAVAAPTQPPPSPAAPARRAWLDVPARMKLTIVVSGSPFTGGRFLADIKGRCAAVGCDAVVLCAIVLAAFAVFGQFWTPFGVSAAGYYFGGILLLGNTPGVCLFAPASTERATSHASRLRARLSS